jgi:D-glycero-alpha-D-manno-heptose-7-phosphate kinase
MLITSRTPLRVSFFGGGTDYPEYFQRARGAVVGMTIDRYVYIAALRLSSTLDYRYRLSYSRVETVKAASDLQHPLVRTALEHFEISEPLDISVMADLPARSGLGSSSAFAVGFINLLASLRRRQITKLDLARQAVFVERELLHENVGVQDQYHAAFGGLNRFDFAAERTRISPVQMTGECLSALTGSLFLMYTGVTRFASATLDEQMHKTRSGAVDRDLSHLLALTGQAVDVLEGSDPERMLKEFGAMLHEGWETKKRLSSKVSNPAIDAMYDAARAAGAIGGKLCGAGSGGFLLMLVPPECQPRFEERFAGSGIIRVNIDTIGSTILTS